MSLKFRLTYLYAILFLLSYFAIVVGSFFMSQITADYSEIQNFEGLDYTDFLLIITLLLIPVTFHLIDFMKLKKSNEQIQSSQILSFSAGVLGLCFFVSILFMLKANNWFSYYISDQLSINENLSVVIEYGQPKLEKNNELNFLIAPPYYVYVNRGLSQIKLGVCKKVFDDVKSQKVQNIQVEVLVKSKVIYLKSDCT